MKSQSTVDKLIVHHSESPLHTTTIRSIREWHTRDNRWPDVGYHAVIESTDKIVRARPENRQGAHVAKGGFNENSLGVCLCGDFDKERPTKEQWLSLYNVPAEWCKKYRLQPNEQTIKGHRDASGETKTCPGENVYMWLPQVRVHVAHVMKCLK